MNGFIWTDLWNPGDVFFAYISPSSSFFSIENKYRHIYMVASGLGEMKSDNAHLKLFSGIHRQDEVDETMSVCTLHSCHHTLCRKWELQIWEVHGIRMAFVIREWCDVASNARIELRYVVVRLRQRLSEDRCARMCERDFRTDYLFIIAASILRYVRLSQKRYLRWK